MYKCESVHYVCTNHIFDTDTNEGWGAKKETHQAQDEHEKQTSTNECEQSQQERGPAMNGDKSDEHEGQPVQPSGDKWAGTSKQMETTMDERQWAWTSGSEHKWGPVSTNGGCPNKWRDKREQHEWRRWAGNNTTTTSRDGRQGQVAVWMVAAAGAMGTVVVWVAAAAETYYLTPCSPFHPFFIYFSSYILLCIFKYLIKKKLIPKICNIIINQISKIINK